MLTPFNLQAGHEIQLLKGGAEFFPALVQDIDQAQQEIHLETYICNFKSSSADVAQALMRAAQRGVKVCVIVDGIGSADLEEDWRAQFKNAGVVLKVFSPLGRLGLLGLLNPRRWNRLHSKLCVIDQRIVFCGGINLLDDLFDLEYGELTTPRLDYAVRVTGPLVFAAAASAAQLQWRMVAFNLLPKQKRWQIWRTLRAVQKSWRESLHQAAPDSGAKAALIVRNNFRHRNKIESAYYHAINAAQTRILIANAYFLPGRKLRRALIRAAKRGVKVQVLVQGKYESFFQYYVARYIYARFLRNGVELVEYAPSFMHAKVAVFDTRWAMVGSCNLDPLSLLMAREANVLVEDPNFSHQLQSQLETSITQESRVVQLQEHLNRSWREALLSRLAYSVMQTMLWLTGKRY